MGLARGVTVGVGVGVARTEEASVVRGEGGNGVCNAVGGGSSSLGTGEDVTVSVSSVYESVVEGDAESKAVVAVDGVYDALGSSAG